MFLLDKNLRNYVEEKILARSEEFVLKSLHFYNFYLYYQFKLIILLIYKSIFIGETILFMLMVMMFINGII